MERKNKFLNKKQIRQFLKRNDFPSTPYVKGRLTMIRDAMGTGDIIDIEFASDTVKSLERHLKRKHASVTVSAGNRSRVIYSHSDNVE